jgi:hypothetical protein
LEEFLEHRNIYDKGENEMGDKTIDVSEVTG